MEYRYSLDNTRPVRLFLCPQCRKKTLKRYVDAETGSYLDDHIGRCNRELNCGYHSTPKENINASAHFPMNAQVRNRPHALAQLRALAPHAQTRSADCIAQRIFEKTLKHYPRNNFYQFLVSQFGKDSAAAAAECFYIGTSKHWPGATIFWQVDLHNRIRTGKIMLYNSESGRRVKEPFNHITWVHRMVAKDRTYHLNQCFFGEHQLISASKQMTVGVVESEKTAIVASILMPELIWLACGSVSNLSVHKFNSIADWKIILYPDLGAFDKWAAKAKELNSFNLNVHVSDLLEKFAHADERAGGYDLADYLLR